MLRRKKLHRLVELEKFFLLLISFGFLNLSQGSELTNAIPAQNISSNISSSVQIGKNNNARGQSHIVFLHEKWKHRALNLFADYEEPWRDSGVEAKIYDGHQEGGCAFIKASFSF